jgi:hypothetical protein
MRRCTGWGRVAILLATRTIDSIPGHDYATNSLRVEADAICPRCLGWISADHIVRRTGYGLLQHEACPVRPDASLISELTG